MGKTIYVAAKGGIAFTFDTGGSIYTSESHIDVQHSILWARLAQSVGISGI